MMAVADRSDIPDEAVEHFVRIRKGPLSDPERTQLADWLAADPANVHAFAELEELWGGLDGIRAEPRMLSIREDAMRSLRRRRWARLARPAVAAACVVVLCAAGWLALVLNPFPHGAPAGPVLHTTSVGEVSTVALADGTSVTLDTDSAVEVRMEAARRSVHLLKGRALFRVRKDPSRPFVVTSMNKSIVALGTEFDVYATRKALEVTLLQGRIRVRQESAQPNVEPQSVEMRPGTRLTAADNRWELRPVTPAADLAWLRRTLVFDDAPLSDVVAELNRYSVRKISIATPELARVRMSGVFRTDDPSSLLASIETLKLARIRPTRNGFLLSKF
jgi:transmembrane sensor